MGFALSKRSIDRLIGVHPDLVRVVELAAKLSPLEFLITEGVRSEERQRVLYGQGRSPTECIAGGIEGKYSQPDLARVTWTMRSKHFATGTPPHGRAVDFVPLKDGAVNWHGDFKAVADVFKSAADSLGVAIEWGGDWRGSADRPHVQLAPERPA